MAKNAEREEGRRTWTDEHMQTHGGRVSSRKKQTGSVWGSLCTSSAHYNSLKHLQRKVWRLHVEGLSWKKTTGRAASLLTIKPFTFIQNLLLCSAETAKTCSLSDQSRRVVRTRSACGPDGDTLMLWAETWRRQTHSSRMMCVCLKTFCFAEWWTSQDNITTLTWWKTLCDSFDEQNLTDWRSINDQMLDTN